MRRLPILILVALAAGAAAALAWHGTENPGADRAAARLPAVPGAAQPAIAGGPVLELRQRALPARHANPFASPARAAPAPVMEVVPPIPKAPPLPYKYDGSGEVQGQRFVYLTRGERSLMAQAGDTLDGTYAVESVARDHVVLRYLPLDARQVLPYPQGAALPVELALEPAPSRPLALQVDMPAEVLLGHEFVVGLALPGANALNATIEVAFDAEVLRALDGEVRRPGSAIVKVAGARAQLRFQVLTDSPTSTDIELRANAVDPSGRRVAVHAPASYSVSLVPPGGA